MRGALGEFVWARGDTTWAGALDEALARAAGRWRRPSAGRTARSSACSGASRPCAAPRSARGERRRPTGTRPATWRRPSAPASAAGADVGLAVRARPRRRRHRACTSRSSPRTGGTPSGGSCSCAGAWARTGRRSRRGGPAGGPAGPRRGARRRCRRGAAAPVLAARRPPQRRAGRGPRSRRGPSGSARRRRTSPAACSTLWRVLPTIAASSPWVIGPSSRISPSSARPCSSAIRASRAARRPAMSRKWSSSTWLVSRRSSRASSANTWSRIAGTSLTSWRNRSRGRIRVSVASTAVAVAERGAPSSSASAPKNSPGRRVARIASTPVSDGLEIFTRPLSTMNSASPGSPWWKITSPRR